MFYWFNCTELTTRKILDYVFLRLNLAFGMFSKSPHVYCLAMPPSPPTLLVFNTRCANRRLMTLSGLLLWLNKCFRVGWPRIFQCSCCLMRTYWPCRLWMLFFPNFWIIISLQILGSFFVTHFEPACHPWWQQTPICSLKKKQWRLEDGHPMLFCATRASMALEPNLFRQILICYRFHTCLSWFVCLLAALLSKDALEKAIN